MGEKKRNGVRVSPENAATLTLYWINVGPVSHVTPPLLQLSVYYEEDSEGHVSRI